MLHIQISNACKPCYLGKTGFQDIVQLAYLDALPPAHLLVRSNCAIPIARCKKESRIHAGEFGLGSAAQLKANMGHGQRIWVKWDCQVGLYRRGQSWAVQHHDTEGDVTAQSTEKGS